MEKCNFLKNSRYFDYIEKLSFFENLTSLKELKIFNADILVELAELYRTI